MRRRKSLTKQVKQLTKMVEELKGKVQQLSLEGISDGDMIIYESIDGQRLFIRKIYG